MNNPTTQGVKLPAAAYAFAVETWGRAWVENEAGDLHAFAALASPAVVPQSVRRLSEAAQRLDRALVEQCTGTPDNDLVRARFYTEMCDAWQALRTLIADAPPSGPTVIASDRDGHWTQISPGDGFMWHPGPQSLGDANVVLDAPPSGRAAEGIAVDVQTMNLSGGRVDYYVRIKCGDREVTPYVFRERYKAEYEAAHFAWIFGLRTDEPDVMAYDEASHPSVPTPPASAGDVDVHKLREAVRPFVACVFNDNGDVTISTGHLTDHDWLRLYRACAPGGLATAPAAPEPAAGGDGWQPISTRPNPETTFVDLPGDAEQGVGFATDEDTGEVLYLVWWKYCGMGRSETTHWRPLPEAPSTPTRADAGADGRR